MALLRAPKYSSNASRTRSDALYAGTVSWRRATQTSMRRFNSGGNRSSNLVEHCSRFVRDMSGRPYGNDSRRVNYLRRGAGGTWVEYPKGRFSRK